MTAVARLMMTLALIACTHPPAPLASNSSGPVVTWHTGNGWTTLTIDRAGLARYDFHPTGRDARESDMRQAELHLEPAELSRLESQLRACGACKLRPSGRLPVSEESPQALDLAFSSLTCHVELLANDWSEPPARGCGAALDELTERVRTSGTHAKS
jgi:hypothetical protein